MRKILTCLTIPLLMIASQPAQAAHDLIDSARSQQQTSAFAGFHFRMNLGSRATPAPTARFRLGMTRYYGGERVTNSTSFTPALELGLTRRGQADLFVSGHRLTEVRQQLGIAPVGAVLLAVGGLGLGAVAVSELADEDEPFCMIEPWLCPGGVGF